jgi:hypothetical protein
MEVAGAGNTSSRRGWYNSGVFLRLFGSFLESCTYLCRLSSLVRLLLLLL